MALLLFSKSSEMALPERLSPYSPELTLTTGGWQQFLEIRWEAGKQTKGLAGVVKEALLSA
jgi:hypothetical protein